MVPRQLAPSAEGTHGDRRAPAPGAVIVRPMRRSRMLLAALAIAGALGLVPPAASQGPRTATMRLAFPSEDGSLTPYTFTNGYALMTLVYDTLTWRDADGIPR